MSQMREDIKQRWVAALRSGEYLQGVSTLHKAGEDNPDTYSCLGVLCELAVQDGIVETWSTELTTGVEYVYGHHGLDVSSAFLPDLVQKWAGLTGQNPRVTADPGSDYIDDVVGLSSINDSGHYTFDQIADIIDREL